MGQALLSVLLFIASVVQPAGLVVLLTDYGADSLYVGILKGAVYRQAPAVRIETLTNSISPFDVVEGAYTLWEACGEFPRGTVFCCVVDPGVGSDRKPVALLTESEQWFVAPDNGLLWLVAQRDGVRALHAIENAAVIRTGDTSYTFHGRDIFGPAAAALAQGMPVEELGPRVESLTPLSFPLPRVEDGKACGAMIRDDVYGNVLTNLRREHLEALNLRIGDRVRISVEGKTMDATFVRTYSDVPVGAPLVLLSSAGWVELAINQGNMRRALGGAKHAPVTLEKRDEAKPSPDGEKGRGDGKRPGDEAKNGTEAAMLVQFTRSGGFAGIVDRLMVREDGVVDVQRRMGPHTSYRLPADRVAALRDVLGRLPSVSAGGAPDAPRVRGADFLVYRIEYQGRVYAFTSLDDPEAMLREAVTLLNGLLDEVLRNATP